MKYTHILQTDKVQKDFYLMSIKKIIKNLLKLFNETDKNFVLAVLSNVFPKRILKKKVLFFQILRIELLKESILPSKKEMKQLIKKQKNSKK